MKIIIKRIFLFTLLVSVQSSLAQDNLQEKADYLFSELFYAEAIPVYEKLLNSGKNTDYANQRLAECHLKMRNVEKAIPHLKVAVLSATPPPPDFYFMYGMALYNMGDKKGAETWLKKYDKHGNKDVRVKTFLQNGSLAPIAYNKGNHYEVEAVDFNSTYSDFGAFVNGDNLYFTSARTNNKKVALYGWNGEPWLDIFMIKENDPLAKPIPLPGNVNSDYHESSMVFSLNHKKETVLYFTGNKYFRFKGKNYFKKKKKKDVDARLNLKIFSAIKSSGKWKVNQDLPINSEHYSTGHPFVTSDGKRLYFTSDRPGGYGGSDIYYAPIHKRGGIGQPKNAGPIINTSGNEMFPFMDKEGHLFFTSDGHVGFGMLDIFSTVLNKENKIIGITNLGSPINSPADDFGYFEHDSGNTGYISSNRDGGLGSDDIYKFMFVPSLAIEGIVTDVINKKALDSVNVTIRNQTSNKIIAELLTDKYGRYKTFINRDSNYRIEVNRKTHSNKSIQVKCHEVPKKVREISQNIALEPVLDLKVLAGLNKLKFYYGQSNIRADAALELDKVVNLLTDNYPNMVIRIEAHTLPLGSHIDNDLLSTQRAKSIHDYLIANGVSENNIDSYQGFGKRKSINGCDDNSDCTNKEFEMSERIEFPIVQIKRGGNDPILNSVITKNK
ncbi:flagellar motor protein MotB [Maribacter algarum]|uniref:Flagellar motor protein MotB n=1 Tax=Maribacter algarum (ex Zhang et al. 2020) TaxID=2578118 RepID=A0A5S3PTV2_9FLAO|nr:OmpA family protein [Maribacter algarum]TMM56120.1 flagellar motor protein MotB [Maribacter algarum]